ncbi:transposase [Bacillus sp. NP157]|nr:transposase [Bacillus sp. NP157]
MTTRPGHAALRRGRVSEPGRIYLVTCVAWNRAPIFRDYRVARAVSRIIHSPSTWPHARCLAWVLMPDHWHGLIELGESDLSRVVGRMKSQVKRSFTAQGRESPVWQRAFQDRALRADEDVKLAARYIVANPVRAGLVENVCDYPYWNAVWL